VEVLRLPLVQRLCTRPGPEPRSDLSPCLGSPRSGWRQGLTLVRSSAQLKRILWDRGAFRGCFGCVQEVSRASKEYQGVFQGVFDVRKGSG
jgi:hypothetical protein